MCLGHLFIGLSMLVAAGLSLAVKPHPIVLESAVLDLSNVIPRTFGRWQAVEAGLIQMDLTPRRGGVPNQDAVLYDQTLLRTYRNDDGKVIMLALAYGRLQRQELKIHRPEVCYVAQGFQVSQQFPATFEYGKKIIATTQLVARNDRRIEPVTYLIRIGNSFVRNAWQSRSVIFLDGLHGQIPDGILVRVASVQSARANRTESHELHEAFLRDLLDAVGLPVRELLVGAL